MTPLRACAGATILGMVVVFVHAACAQTESSPAYFPYPPGVIPTDVDQEIQRVQGEVDHIFQPLNFSQFVGGRRWCTGERAGLAEARFCA